MIARENAALQKRSLDITELLFKSGNESELDVQQAKAQYLGTLATIPQLEGVLRQTQNALSTLLARAPGPLPEMAAGKDVIPQAELAVIVDMPADLLRRRPDVRAAEMQLAAQSALIGVSVADLYPSISLLGSVGLSATSLGGCDAGAELGRRARASSGTCSTMAGSPTRCWCRMRASSSSMSSIRTRCCGRPARSTTPPSALPRPASRSCCSQTP